MLKDFLQIQTLSLVFLGDFNPVILQPFWLAHKKLIRDQEALETKVEIIHNELVRFNLDWLFFEVTKDRLILRTSKDPFYEPLIDLCTGILEILSETPIKALGINHTFHYALPDEERYIDFGNKIAPLKNWEGILSNPKVLELEVIEQNRRDKKKGYYRIAIQPSDRKLSTPYAIMLNINDHFDLNTDINNKEFAHKAIKENWKNSYDRAIQVPEKLWKNIE